MECKINIPDTLVTELNTIAEDAAFTGYKKMLIAYLRFEIRTHRGNEAAKGIREEAERLADIETNDIV